MAGPTARSRSATPRCASRRTALPGATTWVLRTTVRTGCGVVDDGAGPESGVDAAPQPAHATTAPPTTMRRTRRIGPVPHTTGTLPSTGSATGVASAGAT